MKLLSRVLTHDFFPGLSASLRRVVYTPLGCLLLATAVAVLCGLVVHPRVFALAGGLLVVAAAGVCWPWVTVRGVRAVVGFDQPRTTEGDEVGATVTVTNHLPWPAWGLTVRDGTTVRLPAIGGRARTACRWVFVPPVRGEYPAAPPRIATGFPFGMWESKWAAAVERRLIVWPRTFPVGPVPTTDGDEVVEGNVTRNKVGATGDVLGVRPYRRGDSPRRIHWAQSAKHDRLIVCELQSNSRPVVLLVLDADPEVHTGGPDGSREWAVRVTASLAKGWLDAGAQVGAVWGTTTLSPLAGRDHGARILDALARLPAGCEPLADVLTSPAVRSMRAAVRVVVTTDARQTQLPPSVGDVRWAVLRREGFGGPPAQMQVRPWLEVRSVDEVAHQLRYGTAEATHGT